MATRKRPTAEDRLETIRVALGGLAAGADITDVGLKLGALHPRNNTFPAEVLLELAADALEMSSATREDPIDYEGIRERYLPECHFSGKTDHHKSHYALRSVAMIRAGLTPDLLDEVTWWRSDDLWTWSWYALVVFVRVAAERTGTPVAAICEQIAGRHSVDLGPRAGFFD
jgi:hypothetical protein